MTATRVPLQYPAGTLVIHYLTEHYSQAGVTAAAESIDTPAASICPGQQRLKIARRLAKKPARPLKQIAEIGWLGITLHHGSASAARP
jgi:hypothetical protein